MFSKFKISVLMIFCCFIFVYAEYTKYGEIESVRDDGFITVIFSNTPEKESYYISEDEKIIGTVTSLKELPGVYGKKRYLCKYMLSGEQYKHVLRAGLDIVFQDADKEIDKRVQQNTFTDSPVYKAEILSLKDRREMVLIPSGKFYFGCSTCEKDEYPEHVEFLGDFYIDKFEVSNSDYKKYADIKGLSYPEYWKGQIKNSSFTSGYFASSPVIVTYHEAAGYAIWAGKRLPVEQEWEKASRPPLFSDTAGKSALYSWGTGFREGIANTEELWLSDKTGDNIKKIITDKYGPVLIEKGYIPVDIFEKESLSYYGVAHLDGNALEWTDSWYKPYPGNLKANEKYGSQYKVIRGGAYFLSKADSRVTDRKIGGMPDLYKDRVAGFRCVKQAAESDKK